MNCIKDEKNGVLICIGKGTDFPKFTDLLKDTPLDKNEPVVISAKDVNYYPYSTIAKSLGNRGVFVDEEIGLDYVQIERIVKEYRDRDYKTIEKLAEEDLLNRGRKPESEMDADWEYEKEMHIRKLLEREYELDAVENVPEPEL